MAAMPAFVVAVVLALVASARAQDPDVEREPPAPPRTKRDLCMRCLCVACQRRCGGTGAAIPYAPRGGGVAVHLSRDTCSAQSPLRMPLPAAPEWPYGLGRLEGVCAAGLVHNDATAWRQGAWFNVLKCPKAVAPATASGS